MPPGNKRLCQIICTFTVIGRDIIGIDACNISIDENKRNILFLEQLDDVPVMILVGFLGYDRRKNDTVDVVLQE